MISAMTQDEMKQTMSWCWYESDFRRSFQKVPKKQV